MKRRSLFKSALALLGLAGTSFAASCEDGKEESPVACARCNYSAVTYPHHIDGTYVWVVACKCSQALGTTRERAVYDWNYHNVG